MSHPVVTLLEEEKVERLYSLLQTYKHDGFPIVDGYIPDLVCQPIPSLRTLLRPTIRLVLPGPVSSSLSVCGLE